ncbi:hypothetical protein AB0K34_45205, partial [Actinomadura sp. NPDC049382]|uniref:hypothetical protein n=1 Tax=Actinomadura sp. NPDC049382 TaxID=3158220 RepID=UPI00341267FD
MTQTPMVRSGPGGSSYLIPKTPPKKIHAHAKMASAPITRRHQQRAEVGVADAELPVVAGRLGDLLGREVG